MNTTLKADAMSLQISIMKQRIEFLQLMITNTQAQKQAYLRELEVINDSKELLKSLTAQKD